MKDNADGSWEVTLHDRQHIRKAFEMQQGARDVEVERGRQVKSKWDGKREHVVRKDGKVVEIPGELVDQVKHRLRPVGRNKSSAVQYYGLSDASRRYVRGPDGLYFVWNDGWEPVSLWAPKDVGGPQRDPDGNVWVDEGGDWKLESEVSDGD